MMISRRFATSRSLWRRRRANTTRLFRLRFVSVQTRTVIRIARV